MNKSKLFSIVLIAIIMVTASFQISFAEEVIYSEFSLISEDSGYKISIPNYIEQRDVGLEYGYEAGEFTAIVMEMPEKNSDGTYTLFEITTTDEDAHTLESFPGTDGQIDNVFGEFIDNKFSYDFHIDSLEDILGQELSCGFYVFDEEGQVIFDVGLVVIFEERGLAEEKPEEEVEEEVAEEVAEEDKPSNWAVAEIEKAKEYNLVTEKVLGNFKQAITREELCELTVKLYEALSGKEAMVPDTNKFTDTDNVEILKANALGIVNGVNETQFSPDSNVTREQIASMIYRTLQIVDSTLIEETSNELEFADKADIANYALESVSFMSNKGILGGVGDNKVDPKGNTTREQGIALITRTFEKFKID